MRRQKNKRTVVNRTLYTLSFYLGMPLVFLRLLLRSRRNPAYRHRWRERLGWYGHSEAPPQGGPRVLFHAVSVGEVHAAVPLVRSLLREKPDCRVVLTTSTPTGSARARALFPREVSHLYLPYDLPGPLRRFLRFTRPDLLVMMETELWPNLLYYCARERVKVLLANARLSEKSRRGYARLGSLVREMLGAVDAVAAQSRADGERLVALGLAPEKLQVSGSVKYDQEVPNELLEAGRRLKSQLAAGRPVLIAASTREGEDARVLGAYRRMLAECPSLLLILVPRHPERFDSAFREAAALDLHTRRRSAWPDSGAEPPPGWDDLQVLVGDSMGEMMLYYGAADLAFVGGSLVDTGCQNILEPAALGLPVLTGPSLYNFQAIADEMRDAGALRVVENEENLARAVLDLLQDDARRAAMGEAALRVVTGNRGATDRILAQIEALLE